MTTVEKDDEKRNIIYIGENGVSQDRDKASVDGASKMKPIITRKSKQGNTEKKRD